MIPTWLIIVATVAIVLGFLGLIVTGYGTLVLWIAGGCFVVVGLVWVARKVDRATELMNGED